MRSGSTGRTRITRHHTLALALVACAIAARAEPHWSTAHPLPEPLQEFSAAVLDGKIYIAGGIDQGNKPTTHAYRYDPTTDTWERIGDLPAARHHMPLAVAHDTLYAVGGLAGNPFQGQSTLWAYRPDLNIWLERARLPVARGASAVAEVDGQLIVVGGIRFVALGGLAVGTAIYDPATNTWRRGANIPVPRDHLTAQAVGGIMYAIGGRPLDPDRNYNIVEAYDLKTNQWTTKDSMPTRRGGIGSAVLDGKIHVLGGESRAGVFTEHEVYDPATNRWSTALPLPTGRHGLGVVSLGGKIYVIGGGPRPAYGQTDVVDIFTP